MQNNEAKPEATAGVPTADEFVKVEGGEPERTSAEASVVVAYLLMWSIMVFFVWRTLKALTGFTGEVDELARLLKGGK